MENLLSNFQLYALSKNKMLHKEIKNDIAKLLAERKISEEEEEQELYDGEYLQRTILITVSSENRNRSSIILSIIAPMLLLLPKVGAILFAILMAKIYSKNRISFKSFYGILSLSAFITLILFSLVLKFSR